MIELSREIHFWQTWWFWVLTTIILFFAIFIFVRSRIERSRRNQVRLEVKIAERTREIRLQKTKIEEQNRLIEEEKNKVMQQQALLQIEKDKTEQWLNNTLPSEVVIELKRSGISLGFHPIVYVIGFCPFLLIHDAICRQSLQSHLFRGNLNRHHK